MPVIKRRFNGGNYSRSIKLQNKETKLKNVLYDIYRAIQILNEGFYKVHSLFRIMKINAIKAPAMINH